MQTTSAADLDPSLPIARISRQRYERMIEAGIFDEDDRVELLNGLVVSMSPQNPPHAEAIAALTRVLVRLVDDMAEVRVQLPFAAHADSEPEPDLVVVPLPRQRGEHPDRALLVVEVADSSGHRDRVVKAAIYAAAAVPEYWIVDVVRQQVEVYSEPLGDHYGACHVARIGDRIDLLALPGRSLAVADVFPV